MILKTIDVTYAADKKGSAVEVSLLYGPGIDEIHHAVAASRDVRSVQRLSEGPVGRA